MREIDAAKVLSLHSPLEGFRAEFLSSLESLNHSVRPNARKKWTFIKAHTNNTAAPIVKSGLVIALSKICSLHRREIDEAKVLSLHSLLEGFRAEFLSSLESLNHSVRPNARKKWTFIKAHTNNTAAPIVKSGLVIALSKICSLHRREIDEAKVLSLHSLL